MDTIVDIQAATPEIAVIEIAETDSSEEKERERVEARRSPRLTRTVHDMNSLQYPHGHWLIIIQRRDAYRKASGCRLHPTDPIEMILKIDCKVSDRGTGPQAVSSQASTTGIIRTHCSRSDLCGGLHPCLTIETASKVPFSSALGSGPK